MITPERLHTAPNALAAHYTRFDVANRLLLTGHSHQAWPDRGFEGQQRAWLDAARDVDEKWEIAFEKAERVRRGYAHLLDDDEGSITLASNTHELVVRFISALPLRERRRLVTTDGEFHTIRRQLDRLAEEGIEIVKVPAEPTPGLAERIVEAIDDRTAAVLVSTVLFQTARIVPDLGAVMDACRLFGAMLLVDAYHHLNVVPFSLRRERLEEAFVIGGGYKYCQLGEGNAFLRAPAGCAMRPIVTGWFAEFGLIATTGRFTVPYADGPERFAGATYDPTSQYRAAEVLDFFEEQGLTPGLLRDVSQHQLGVLIDAFDALDLDPAIVDRDRSAGLHELGGFLALRSPHAGELQRWLRERGVRTDHRGEILRLGPAPYLSDDQLLAAVAALGECARELPRAASPEPGLHAV